MIKNLTYCGVEQNENDEAKSMKEMNNETVMVEEIVDPPMERDKHKENGMTNLGYEDHFQGNKVEVKMEGLRMDSAMTKILVDYMIVKQRRKEQAKIMNLWFLKPSGSTTANGL